MSDAVAPSLVLSLVVVLLGLIIVKCWFQNRYMKRRIGEETAIVKQSLNHDFQYLNVGLFV